MRLTPYAESRGLENRKNPTDEDSYRRRYLPSPVRVLLLAPRPASYLAPPNMGSQFASRSYLAPPNMGSQFASRSMSRGQTSTMSPLAKSWPAKTPFPAFAEMAEGPTKSFVFVEHRYGRCSCFVFKTWRTALLEQGRSL